ncbi:Glycosyltransferase RgtA/B/C/D-like domain-containing protein [Flavobacterium longum]|uniref:glycosyltransferase family 39 protein n=1 Tax=Flavobacterium longum TaxID=1299340 RepID=UPI0039E9AEBC
MSAMLYRFRFPILLIAAAMGWLVVFAWLSQIDQQGIIYADSTSYVESARNFYVHLRGHNYRPILMAAINGLPYLFGFGDAAIYEFSFYVNVFCWLATSLMLYALLKDVVRPKIAFFFALAFLFTLGNVSYVFHLLTENIYLFFIVSAFYFLSKYYKSKRFRDLSFALSIIVLAMLIRPGSMLLGIAMTVFFLREIIRNFKSKAAFFLYGSIALVLVQCAGIKHQFGNFTISYIDAVTYYGYLGSRAEAMQNGTEYIQENNPRGVAMYSLPMPEQKKLASEDFEKQLTTNTVNFFKAYAIDLLDNTKSGNTALMDCKNVEQSDVFFAPELFWASKWQNRILTVIGFGLAVFFFFRGFNKEPLYFLMACYILYIVLLSGVSCSQGDRFHIVTYPFVLLLLAKFLQRRKNLA